MSATGAGNSGGKSGWQGKSGWSGKGKGISLADSWPGAQVNMGGSVEGVEIGVSELERDDSWTTVTQKMKKNIGRDPVKVDVSKLASKDRMIQQMMSINSIDKPGVSFTPSEINGLAPRMDGIGLVCRSTQGLLTQ